MIRATLALAFVLVLGVDASAQEKKEKTDKELLIGSWKMVIPNPQNMSVEIVLTFAKENKLSLNVKVDGKEQKASGTWELKDKTITTTIMVPNPEQKETHTIESLDQKNLVTKDSQGQLDTFDRVIEKKK